jgi:uncharacterized protein YuzE
MLERGITTAWLEDALVHPDRTEHAADGTVHYLRQVKEFGDRWLRVVVNAESGPHRVVTLFFESEGFMKVHVDRQADALYIRLNENPIVESEEVQPGVILDFSAEGMVVGVEMLDISKRMSNEDMQSVDFVSA